jgi:hypothetical protein
MTRPEAMTLLLDLSDAVSRNVSLDGGAVVLGGFALSIDCGRLIPVAFATSRRVRRRPARSLHRCLSHQPLRAGARLSPHQDVGEGGE